MMPYVEGFVPSTSGFHFANRFDHLPLRTIAIPIIGKTVTIGDAANGLCGGMVYAACDYFANQLYPPATTTAPDGGPLYEYLVQRLFESWDIPMGIVRYFELMRPQLPDYGTAGGPLGFLNQSRAAVMIQREWPLVRQDLDNNRLSPLGLIKTKSEDPAMLGENHQVVAYGYELDGTNLTLAIYDPNAPNDDQARITLTIASPNQSCQLACTTAPTVYCFFRTHYQKAGPPPDGTPRA
jgi:hypothetical protein